MQVTNVLLRLETTFLSSVHELLQFLLDDRAFMLTVARAKDLVANDVHTLALVKLPGTTGCGRHTIDKPHKPPPATQPTKAPEAFIEP
jgi:hypothetical protein